MDMNICVLQEILKLNKEELDRGMRPKERYKLYSNLPRKKYCVDLKYIKFCI